MNNPEELKELVQQAKYGDSAAFSHLYDFYLTPIFRFIFFRVRSKEDAEDLTQHVFLKAWSALPNYEQEGKSFSAWLYRIARNTTIDYWRKKKSVLVEPDSDLFTTKEDTADNPAQAAQRKEESKKIRDSLHLLNEDQQTILTLKFIEELSNTEISEITGKSEGAIRQVQSRGLKVLRLHFKENNVL
jgi:RNA polymerase sigma-70 factor, ECF subfamily